jgi:hypothetical protein
VRVYFGTTAGHFHILETLRAVETLGHSATSECIGVLESLVVHRRSD